MIRQPIDGGGWLNLQTAKKFTEAAHFDGHNMISVNTGWQWGHQVLYRSVGGVYVLHSWSQWQNSRHTWQRISLDEAVEWLLKNDHDPTSPAEESIAARLEV